MDSKRIRKLRSEIIDIVPKFPNNKATKMELESKHLTDLLIVYLSWAARLITPRPRIIIIEKEAADDKRWKLVSDAFLSLGKKIETGEDLTPYLSSKVQKKGYSPASSSAKPGTDKWADKDFILNVMGFYHLHLGKIKKGAKLSERTDDVVFAKVDRKKFSVIGVFNHSVFDETDIITKSMTLERKRLWRISEKYTMPGVPANTITLSGHNVWIVRLAQNYTRIINKIDAKLDDPVYVNSLYNNTDIVPPKNPKLDWYLRGTDLCVFDRVTKFLMVLKYGIN